MKANLQQLVEERTRKLHEANIRLAKENAERKKLEQTLRQEKEQLQNAQQELHQTYMDLAASQSMIIHQEKMASIGQLAAGVAHKINNPIGFISSNLTTFREYAEDLRSFVRDIAKSSAHGEEMAELLTTLNKRYDIDFILDDINDLINESKEGAERIRHIVQNLRNFSRIDDQGWQQADINELIDSTLNIVWNELKYKAEVKKDYGTLTPVYCCAQELNQVFMNILINGAQAIKEQGIISIKTRQDEDVLKVLISDTGCGIDAENLSKLFDPFFTTKEVGKGTGLGLSISYDIVKKHKGRIEVSSEVGKGTTFLITLPVQSPPESGERSISQEL